MLNGQVVNHLGLVLLHVRNGLLQWELERVEAYQHIALVPILDGLVVEHFVREFQDLDGWSLAKVR